MAESKDKVKHYELLHHIYFLHINKKMLHKNSVAFSIAKNIKFDWNGCTMVILGLILNLESQLTAHEELKQHKNKLFKSLTKKS